MSKAIIRPMMMPRRIALLPPRPSSQLVRPSWRAAIGWPITTSISTPTIRVETSGMTTTGMIPATPRGTLTRLIQMTIAPAISPAARPPGPFLLARRPAEDPGAGGRRVAHGVGDEAGQEGDKQGEGHPADLEQQ